MMDQGSVRNLEQIQESDADSTPRGVTLLLVALGGACIVFAGLAVSGRKATPTVQKADPLGELVTQQAKVGQTAASAAAKSTELGPRDVTFPGILSDEGAPTTALAAVKGNPGGRPGTGTGTGTGMGNSMGPDPSSAIALNVRGADGLGSFGAQGQPGQEGRLPVVPLPAQNVLGASPVVTRPRDSLTRAASDASQVDPSSGPPSGPGHEGGFQLQVSSFRTQGEADQFATQLRARGHKAYVVEAHVPGRGTWFRVRIGPFPSQHAAASYRSGFEGREHVVPFIVPPNK